jgi:hypothetical protein
MSGSGYLHWSNDPFEKMVIWLPDPLVLPLRGSPAPVGYIYDATTDADRGLLAAALAFFSHHGHQVFYNPCLDLDEYRRAMSVSLPIIPVDHLPDHILFSGLELMEALFTPSPTNSFGTVFMAAYLESPPSLCSVPLGGSAAPPGVSGDRLVAPGGVPAGSVLSPMRGIGVNVGASLFNMGGLGVPEGMPVLNMGGLGRWPDPDEGVSAPPCPQHGSPLSLLNPVHLPSYRSPTSGASGGLGIPPPLVAFGGVAGAPLSVVHPPQSVCRPDSDEEGSASPRSRCGALFPSSVSWSSYLNERPGTQSSVDGYQGGRSLSLSSGSHEGPWGLSSSSSLAPPTPPHRRRVIGVLAVLSATNPIGPPPHRATFCSPPSLSLWIGSPCLPSSLAKTTSSQGNSFSTGFELLVFPLPARIRSW